MALPRVNVNPTAVLSLYGFGNSIREEYLLCKLIKTSVLKSVSKLDSLSDFKSKSSSIISLMAAYMGYAYCLYLL